MSFEMVPIPSVTVGNKAHLAVHRFGPKDGKKVYIQAGLHADEHPGLLVAQHLLRHLEQLDAGNALAVEIIIVPFANPIGLRQRSFGHVTGRCDWHTGQNFNRAMAISQQSLIETLGDAFGEDATENDRILRAGLKKLVAERKDNFEIESLHKTLLSLSIDAHYMIDMHCDDIALPHLFIGQHQHETGLKLAQSLGFGICLEEDVTGTVAFDGTHTQPWVVLEKHVGRKLFSEPCFATTLELRGNQDVSPELAEQDCLGILDFLAKEKLIKVSVKEITAAVPKHLRVDQVKLIRAEVSGIVTYRKKLGDYIKTGETFADIVLLDQPSPKSIPVVAPSEGILFSTTGHYFTTRGQTIAMLATDEQQQASGTQLAF